MSDEKAVVDVDVEMSRVQYDRRGAVWHRVRKSDFEVSKTTNDLDEAETWRSLALIYLKESGRKLPAVDPQKTHVGTVLLPWSELERQRCR